MSRMHTLLALAMISWTCAGETLAKDRSLDAFAPRRTVPGTSSLFALPPHLNEPQAFSATEFRPRRQGFAGADAASHEPSIIDAPMPKDTSIGRQLAEFKSQDRVRLLTLWRNSASSLSLQAGRRGMPSLQWSTPLMHRDAVSRGLFDRFLAPRFGGSARTTVPRQAGMTPGKAESSASLNAK